jgi:2-polyprenyl-3-methyl-5-hydroxy-6-metoxy-1,4-benzoquinol methylase
MTTATALPSETFADKLVGILNGGALALMVSIGHRARLFDTMADLAPATSDAIARKAGLNERYVREWLGAMVTGGIVRYDEKLGRYELPAEHASCLTRMNPCDNIAVLTQYIGVLAGVEDRVLECFEKGGGVPYSAYPRFHEVMAEDSGQSLVAALEGSVLPLVPGLSDKLRQGISVLDVGCGAGRAMIKLAGLYPNSLFAGYDISSEAIECARREARRRRLDNVRFEVKDVAALKERGRYDLLCAFDAIHDQAQPDVVLRGIRNTLREDGTFLMQDIRGSTELQNNLDHPIGPLLYTISTMHCMTVSLAAGGKGLGAMWGEEKALAMLNTAGFPRVTVKYLPHDIQNAYYICAGHTN